MSQPRVSICLVTYNHEKWIGEALESVLTQDFEDFEVVVGEDASTDNTRSIVEDHARRDARVRLLPKGPNLGGRENLARTHAACKGEFINVLDGDDYFCSTRKLSLQVALLDDDQTLSACFAASNEVDLNGAPLRDPKHPYPLKDRYDLKDFARYCLSDSAAMMRRRSVLQKMPTLYYVAPQGDWPMHILTAIEGDIGYLPEPLTAYRIHPGGVWNRKTENEKFLSNLRCQELFLEHLPEAAVREIHPVIAKRAHQYSAEARRNDDLDTALVLQQWLDDHCKGVLPWKKRFKERWRLRAALRKSRKTTSSLA